MPCVWPHAIQATRQCISSLRTVEKCHRLVNDLKDMVNTLFQAIFAQRFRDVAPPIRAVVIGGIGAWVHAMPSMFMNDQYLKYLAWALSDGVRQFSPVSILTPFYLGRIVLLVVTLGSI